MIELKPGVILTVKSEIISDGGRIIFSPGDKVEIDELVIKEGWWGRMSGIWHPEEITAVRLVGHSGQWYLSMFIETQNERK